MICILSGQSIDGKQVSPCDDPLVKLANDKGLKAIPLKNILKYRKLIRACENEGKTEYVKKIHEKDWHRDYKRSRNMASWTSTHAMFVLVSFAYYYAGKILATKPESS